jgi:hypothetical protein
VEGGLGGDDDREIEAQLLVRVLAGELDGRLVGLGARVAEKGSGWGIAIGDMIFLGCAMGLDCGGGGCGGRKEDAFG